MRFTREQEKAIDLLTDDWLDGSLPPDTDRTSDYVEGYKAGVMACVEDIDILLTAIEEASK